MNNFDEHCDFLSQGFDALALVDETGRAGVIEAQIAYPTIASANIDATAMLRDPKLAQSVRDNTFRYLESAASMGPVDALWQLADIHNTGVISNRDPTVAYAYLYAITPTGLLDRATQGMMTGIERELTAAQIADAMRRGDQVFDRCCRR